MKNAIVILIIGVVAFLGYKMLTKPNTDAEAAAAALGAIGANKAAEQQANANNDALQQQYDVCYKGCRKPFLGIPTKKDWASCVLKNCNKYLPNYTQTSVTASVPIKQHARFTTY